MQRLNAFCLTLLAILARGRLCSGLRGLATVFVRIAAPLILLLSVACGSQPAPIPAQSRSEAEVVAPTSTPPIVLDTPTIAPPATRTVTRIEPPVEEPVPVTPISPTSTDTPEPPPTPTSTPFPTATPDPTGVWRESLSWYEGGNRILNLEEAAALEALDVLDSKDPALVNKAVTLPWVSDAIEKAEAFGLERLAEVAKADTSLAAMALDLAWMADGITEAERKTLGELSHLSQLDESLARTLFSLPWLADDVTGQEWKALANLRVLTTMDRGLGETLASLAGLKGEISLQEVESLMALRALAESDIAFTKELVAMPFFAESADTHDSSALTSLFRLRKNNPDEFALLIKQSWFKDGIDDEEAIFITVLWHMARVAPDKIPSVLGKHYIESKSVQLPLAGDVRMTVIRLNADKKDSPIMNRMADMIQTIEEIHDTPFPSNSVILFLGDAGGFGPGGDAAGVRVDTHITLNTYFDVRSHEYGGGVLAHELGHYYWRGDNAPPWLTEGGARFLSTYASHELYGEKLESQRSPCSQARTIQEVLNHIDKVGYREHRKSDIFTCNYSLGEGILLELFEALEFENFQAALKDLYHLADSQDRRLNEQEIHSSFMRHTPEAKMDQVKEIYESRHGGDFSDISEGTSAPSASGTDLASYIPLLNASVGGLRFFEKPRGALPRDQRVYAQEFEKATTRYIVWELNLDFPEHGREVKFQIEAVFYHENGSVFARPTYDTGIKEGWHGSLHTRSWGWEKPGRWPLGFYLVELYIDEELVASGRFAVTK